MRTIDADALIDDIEHTLWDWDSVDGITASTVLRQTIADIKNQPTIDAVPVIRCKDCKFSILNDGVYRGSETNGKCIAMGAVVNGDNYCSWAERKEE